MVKRRNFLKILSSIPLTGIPVKALAKTPEVKKYGEYVQAGYELGEDRTDPYEDVVGKGFKEQLLKASKSKNPFHEGMNRGVRAKWRRV